MCEIVRPGMEDSESAEKQENTGIGPASACRGESAFTRVFHALWMEVVASPSCAGRSASETRVNALITRASIFFAKRFLRRSMDCRVKPGNDSEGVVPAKAGTHDHRRWLWVPALAPLGRDDNCLAQAKHQPAAVRNDGRRRFPVSRLLFTGSGATATCRAGKGPMWHHPS